MVRWANRRGDEALFGVLVGEDDGRNDETTMLCSGCLLVKLMGEMNETTMLLFWVLIGEADGRNDEVTMLLFWGACW